MGKILAVTLMFFTGIVMQSQGQKLTGGMLWEDTVGIPADSLIVVKDAVYRTLTFHVDSLQEYINSLPKNSAGKSANDFILEVPLPDGTSESIIFRPSETIPEKLKQKFSHRSFTGVGRNSTVRRATLDITGDNILISIITLSNNYFVSPVPAYDNVYLSYEKRDIDVTKVKRSRESVLPRKKNK